jgi:nicotinamide-nucleotide amidase
VKIELINTGTELLLGRRLNTHAHWLGQQLAQIGYPITRQVAIDDSAPAIRQAVSQALQDADIIITTGGLGPTSDDRTRDLIAELAGLPLSEDANVLANIERFFALRKRPQMPASVRKQALVPKGATVLMNQHGTAPGLVLELPKAGGGFRLLIMLPGPPRELRPMFEEQVVPLLQQRCPTDAFAGHVFRTSGLGESFLEEKVAGPLTEWTDAGMDLAYCAHPGEVEVRISIAGPKAQAMVDAAAGVIRAKLGQHLYRECD